MLASECRRYAEICLDLADKLSPKHRGFLIDQANQWLSVAELLDQEDDQSGKVNGFSAPGTNIPQ